MAAAVIAVAATNPAAIAQPQRPTDDSLVLLTLPAGRSGPASELRSAQAALEREPENLDVAVRTARIAIEQGRSSADPRSYGQAEAALAPWWRAENPPVEVRVLRAVIRQAQHDFPGALSDLDAVLTAAPNDAQARLTRAFVRMVVGDLGGAAEDCRRVPASVGMLPAAACRARLGALTGSAQASYDALSRSLAFGSRSGEAMRRFATSLLAEIAVGLGRREDADRLFAETVASGAPDVPVLTAAADQLLDVGRDADALKLLDGKGAADVLMLRQAIAAKKTGDPRQADWAAILNERFVAAKAAGVRVHLREEARFRLEVEGDAAAALPLAQENWTVQKEPADARLLLACSIAAKDPAAAAEVVRFIDRTGLSDARIAPLLEQVRAKT